MDMASEMDARSAGTHDQCQRDMAELNDLRAEVERLRATNLRSRLLWVADGFNVGASSDAKEMDELFCLANARAEVANARADAADVNAAVLKEAWEEAEKRAEAATELAERLTRERLDLVMANAKITSDLQSAEREKTALKSDLKIANRVAAESLARAKQLRRARVVAKDNWGKDPLYLTGPDPEDVIDSALGAEPDRLLILDKYGNIEEEICCYCGRNKYDGCSNGCPCDEIAEAAINLARDEKPCHE